MPRPIAEPAGQPLPAEVGTLILADHLPAIGTRAATSRAVCDCGWRGDARSYPAHLTRALADAGLLKETT